MTAPYFFGGVPRVTAVFAAGGIAAYLISLWIFDSGPDWALMAVSVCRLAIGAAPALWIARRLGGGGVALYPLALAIPYPVSLARYVYSTRFAWLPERLAIELGGPTALLITVAAALLASRWVTAWAVNKATGGRSEEAARRLGNWLFALTAIGVIFAPSTALSLWFLQRVVEPVAMIGYCVALSGKMESQ